MRSPRICRRALLIGHLKANHKSKDAGRKCAEESAAFEVKGAKRGEAGRKDPHKSRRLRLCVRRSRLRENSSYVQQEKGAIFSGDIPLTDH